MQPEVTSPLTSRHLPHCVRYSRDISSLWFFVLQQKGTTRGHQSRNSPTRGPRAACTRRSIAHPAGRSLRSIRRYAERQARPARFL